MPRHELNKSGKITGNRLPWQNFFYRDRTVTFSDIVNKRASFDLNIPIPAFFLLLLVFQIFFMPGLIKQGGRLYVPFRSIVVGGSFDNPPYEFLDENNEPAGYNVELTRAIAADMGIEVTIRLGGRSEIADAFAHGKVDILQGIMESDDLAKNNLFYPCSVFSHKLFARQPGSVPITSLKQLEGEQVVLSRNTPFAGQLKSEYPAVDFLLAPSHFDALQQLARGRAAYALVVNLPGPSLSRKLMLLARETGTDPLVQVAELSASGRGYGYVARDDRHQFLTHINDSFINLTTSGRHNEIQEAWLGPLSPSHVSKRGKSVQIGGLIFSPLLLAACTVFFWNRSLKREVERRTAELAVQQQQLIQADKMTSLGILVSGVAHEINNPTGLIVHNLSALQRVYETAESVLEERYRQEGDFFIRGLKYSLMREESAEIFTEMHDGARRITQIVNDLKDFARKDSPALTETASLNEVVRASVRLLDSSLRKQNCSVHLDLADSLPAFRGNSRRIEQVVINLLLNACQAGSGADQTVCIRTRRDEKENSITLDVEDRGEGIAEDQLPFLFDPFYTTRREQGGTGLGLSISERIVKEHQGRLQFTSRKGYGTTVSMTLPGYEEA